MVSLMPSLCADHPVQLWYYGRSVAFWYSIVVGLEAAFTVVGGAFVKDHIEDR